MFLNLRSTLVAALQPTQCAQRDPFAGL